MVICTAQYSTCINSAKCTLHWEHPGGQRSSVLGRRDRRNVYRGNGCRPQRREGCLGYRREPSSARVLPNFKVDLIRGTFCTLAMVQRRRSRNDSPIWCSVGEGTFLSRTVLVDCSPAMARVGSRAPLGRFFMSFEGMGGLFDTAGLRLVLE